LNPTCGFYWTEGHRGIGWSEECVPPIKIGSGLGIPSSPAVWDPLNESISKLDIRDVERLQGFPTDWTLPAEKVGKHADRWKLVGNSVSVPLGEWIGSRLRYPTEYDFAHDWPLLRSKNWPNAAWGENGHRYASSVSMWPLARPIPLLLDFLEHPGPPLSTRAAAGLLKRIENGSTNVPGDFLRRLRDMSLEEERRLAIVKCEGLEGEITRLSAVVRRSTQFAEKIEMNQRIKELQVALRDARTVLCQ
jgi:DNA (cytosine-5)-methyltransferase 1